MGGYKIKVNVELVECDASEHDLTKEMDGSFTMTISEADAISIDNCENSVLRTAHPAIREAISRHLSEISKKKLLKTLGQSKQ